MLKNAFLKRTVCLTTIFSFTLAYWPKTVNAYSYLLAPQSFDEMYSLAKSGQIEALRASVNRGLNIDIMNSDGYTGLCLAAERGDAYTYNAFRAAGANPRHPCTQYIENYEDFVSSSRAVPVTSTPRDAYGTLGKESYSISPKTWWWIGGAALAGGVAALALGGHGGGGSSSSNSSGGGNDNEDYNSLGAIVGTKGKIKYSISKSMSDNSSYINMENSDAQQTSKIDINSNVLENTKYMNVALNASDNAKYTNTADTVLDIGEGTVAMNAVKDSFVNNFGFINIDSFNASIGMIASENSSASNYGKGIINNSDSSNNGIALNFSGYKDENTLIGMYADTKSILHNYGDIKGTAIEATEEIPETEEQENSLDSATSAQTSGTGTSAASGTLVGMEAMIVNAGNNLNKNTINLYNESGAKINLSAGDAGASDNEIKVSLIGMGSFLDYGFMNGSKNINRAEKVNIYNKGDITLGYTGNYTSSSDTSLRKGTGGIIGIRADANASSYNTGNITLNLDEYSAESSNIDSSAGMLSVHGGNLSNLEEGSIKIITSSGNQRKNYGMVSVEGSGTASELYTNLNQILSNSGKINIQASNSFGIASFNGGTLNNTGTITLGVPESTTQYQKNIAMYGYAYDSNGTKMENTGIIDIYSHDSSAMQNDYSGATVIYNNGTINIHESATNSYVFGGSYSEAHNANTINYYAFTEGSASSEGTRINPFKKYTISIGNSVMSTSGKSVIEDSSPSNSSSTTEKIFNDENATINIYGSSFTTAMYVEKGDNSDKTQGKAYNNGDIYIYDNTVENTENSTNSIGMYLGENSISNANITNNGSIYTKSKFSAAMASSSTENASVVNNGTISVNKEYSLGIYSQDFTKIQNSGTIDINSDYSTAIYTTGTTGKSEVINNDTINVGTSSSPVEYSFGIYADENSWHSITNNGTINIYTENAGYAIFSTAASNDEDKNNDIKNKGIINSYSDNTCGIYVKNDIYVTNYKDASINIGTAANPLSNVYGIYNDYEGENEFGEIINKGNINIYADSNGYGIYSSGDGIITNEGNINVVGGTSIYGGAKFINAQNSTVSSSNSHALDGIADVTNNGTISASGSGNAISGASNVTNNGYIYAINGHGIYSENPENIINNGTISISGTGDGIHVIIPSVESEVNIVNNGTISVNTGHAIYIKKDYDLEKKEEDVEGSSDTKKITYSDKTNVTPGSAEVTYDGTCLPHCINGEVVYENTSSTATTSSFLTASDPTLLKSINFVNHGVVTSDDDIDFGSPSDENATISIGSDGTYEANSFSGTVLADSSLVEGGFDTVYVNEDAFIGEDNGLNVLSQSYLFTASLMSNDSGNLNLVMTMSSFDDKINDSRISEFLSRNYQEGKGEDLFNILKSAADKNQFDDYLNRELGFSVIPNLTRQSLDTEKTVNNELNNDLTEETTETNRHKVNILTYKNDVDAKNEISGYKDAVIAAYGFQDTAVNKDWRLGISLAAIRSDSDFDDDSYRYNNMLEVATPIIFSNNYLSSMFKPKAGFARGHYRRNAVNKAYKAKTKELFYGFDSSIYNTFDLKVVSLKPSIGFNFTGLYTDDIKENKDGLKIKDNNTVSALAYLGTDIKRKFIFDSKNALSVIIGGKYFHEFGNRYESKSTINDMSGYYYIKGKRLQRNYGLLNLKAVYDYGQFSFTGSVNAPIEHKYNPYYMFNLGYSF